MSSHLVSPTRVPRLPRTHAPAEVETILVMPELVISAGEAWGDENWEEEETRSEGEDGLHEGNDLFPPFLSRTSADRQDAPLALLELTHASVAPAGEENAEALAPAASATESGSAEEEADGANEATEPEASDPALTAVIGIEDKPFPELSESQATEDEAATTPQSAPIVAEGEDPRTLLRQWQGQVRRGAAAIPAPSLGAAGEAHVQIVSRGEASARAQGARRQQLPQKAQASQPPLPEVPAPPAPPAQNPIPTQVQAILDAAGKKLTNRELPPLVTRPGGTPPRLGQQPIDPRVFQALTTPPALDATRTGKDGEDPEQRLHEEARKTLTRKLPPLTADAGASVALTIEDKGAPPITPLPPQLKTPVASVVARLLAEPHTAAERLLKELKRIAYPGMVLTKDVFATLGSANLPELETEYVAELRRVASASGVTAQELDKLVDERRSELEEKERQASAGATGATRVAQTTVNREGGETLGAIAALRGQLTDEAIARQEAISGGADPAVIEARRSQVSDWVRERVTVETTNYKRQGEARTQAIAAALREQQTAYTWAAQRDEYALLNSPKPLAQRPPDEQARLQESAKEIRAFATDRAESLKKLVTPWLEEDAKAIEGWRKGVEEAGTAAIRAARTWADRRVDEGRSWFEKLTHRVRTWYARSQEETIVWEARVTEETRDSIANDLIDIGDIEAKVREGQTKETLLADKDISEDKRALIEAYFATTPDAEGNRDALGLVARRLEMQIAKQRRGSAQASFERELLAPGYFWESLNLVGAAEKPGFNAADITAKVHAAVDQWGTDEAAIWSSLSRLTKIQIAAVRAHYLYRYHTTIDEDLASDLSDDELSRAQNLLSGDQTAADAYALRYAVEQWGTDEQTIYDTLRNQTPEERAKIVAYYNQHFKPPLKEALKDDMSGHELDRALALSEGKVAEADAIALDEAMRGGFWGDIGTDEAQIEQTYKTIRAEVLAQAQREGWSSEKMEAEVARRNAEVEAAFETRYGNDYRAPGQTGSALRIAFEGDLSGPELDLANALQDNNLAKADAARIEIERQSVVYADDEVINGVLKSQYERSLEAVRLDEGPGRRKQVEAALQGWSLAHPDATADDLSREQMRLDREMERALEDAAQERSRVSMQQLEDVYKDQYDWRGLRYQLHVNMSGDDLAEAKLLLNQGGRLTPAQEADFAMRGLGTREERLKTAVKGRTKAELEEIRKEWNRTHPGVDFDKTVLSEVSGRDAFELRDMLEHGAPESASERAAELRRANEYEMNHGSLLGGAIAQSEATYLAKQMARLDEIAAELHKPVSADERERILFEFNVQAAVAQDAIEDHKRASERIGDILTQVVSITVAVVVGIGVGIVTAGAGLGPYAAAIVTALAASAAGTISSMGTKYAVMGADYGVEDMGIDLAVGIVDALAAVATAGVGSAVVGRLMPGFASAARAGGGTAARTAGTATARASGNRVKQTLEKWGAAMAHTKLASKVGKIPAMRRFAQAKEGTLARLVGGSGRSAGRAATEAAASGATRAATETAQSGASKVFAEALSESFDNLIQSAPSAFAASIMDDTNWHGNVILNIVGATGQQVGQGMVMGSAMVGGQLAGRGARAALTAGGGALKSRRRTRTPEGRVMEGSRRLGAGYVDYVADHPSAGYHEYAASSQGKALLADLEARGMLPTPENLEAGLPAARTESAAPPQKTAAAASHPAPELPATQPRAADLGSTATAPAAATSDIADGAPAAARGTLTQTDRAPVQTERAPSPTGSATAQADGATARPGEITTPAERSLAPPDRASAMPISEARGAHPASTPETAVVSRADIATTARPARAAETSPHLDAASAPLRAALPDRLRASVPIEVRSDLAPGSVHVTPVRERGRIVGVKLEVGRGATPTDILLHSHVVDGYRRYVGLLGRARELVERFHAWFTLQQYAGPGTTAFEARMEVGKLPALIEERMARLTKPDLSPEAKIRLNDEIANLQQQLDFHSTRLKDFSEGRGFIAAEGLPARTDEPPRVTRERERAGNEAVKAAYERAVALTPENLGAHVQATRTAYEQAIADQATASNRLVTAKETLDKLLARRSQPAASTVVTPPALPVDASGAPTPEAPARKKGRQPKPLPTDADIAAARAEVEAAHAALDDANRRHNAGALELTGALEATQTQHLAKVPELEARIRDLETQQAKAIAEAQSPPSADERALAREIESIKKEIGGLGEDSVAERAPKRALEREMAAKQKELADLRTPREEANRARAAEVRESFRQQIDDLNAQVKAIKQSSTAAVAEALATGRGRDFPSQGYHHLGQKGVVPCFPAGVTVKTPLGDRAIGDLAEGDMVWSYDFASQRRVSRPVTHIWRNWTQGLYRLELAGAPPESALDATGGHPIWSELDGGWKAARDLAAGAMVRTIDQELCTVASTQWRDEPCDTCNLELAGAHTYFVGAPGILVHNAETGPKFMRTVARRTAIYVFYYTPRNGKRVPIYVGKTHQDITGVRRESQHLLSALNEAEINRKAKWLAAAARGELEMVVERTGTWTEFETAVWEEHLMREHGGLRRENLASTLDNKIHALTPETYHEYKTFTWTDSNGVVHRHNPCPK